ncbi:MAG: hypothetical protein GX348_03245 [Veillonellaceae bacterium]|nr:hypothetical protein [Veillonellaceae bacterium]
MSQSFTIILKDQPDTLVRLTGLLYRRGYLIENLVVQPAAEASNVLVNISIRNCKTANQLLRQLDKLFNVVTAEVTPPAVQSTMGFQASLEHGYTSPI